MPYKAFKVGNKYEVKKLGADGKPTGKALGTHPTMAKANQQVKALYASETGAAKKETAWTRDTFYKDLPSAADAVADSEDANSVTWTKDVFGDITPRIVSIDKTKDHGEMAMDMPMMPMPTMATSFADLMAQRDADEMAQVVGGLTDDFATLACNISCDPAIEDKAAALAKLAQEFQDLVMEYAKHEDTETVGGELEEHLYDADAYKALKIAKQIAGDNQPKARELPEDKWKPIFVWKEGDTYRWISAYSNNRQDDEAEIISSTSHKEFDQALHNKEWPMPELYLWHIPYPVGQADYHAYDESSGFPVAAGHFYSGMEWAAEGVVKEGWNGASHGMPVEWLKYEPTNNKIIIRHRTKEITFLPLWAAANKLAFSVINKEKEMEEVQKGLPAHKRPEFVKAFGEERVKQIEDALASKSKEADEAGVAKKEETPTLTKEDFVKGLEVVLDKVKEAVDSLDTRLGKLEAAQVKEADAFDIMAQLKAKSIIGNDAAKVRANSALAKDAPEETQPQAANQHPVSLINNLFAANAAWAERLSGGR